MCKKQGGSGFGQLALRRPLSALDRASGCPELRPASAIPPRKRLWPAILGVVSLFDTGLHVWLQRGEGRVEQRGATPRAARRHGRPPVRRLASDAELRGLRRGRGAAGVGLDVAVALAALFGVWPEVKVDTHEVGPRLGEDAPDDQGRRAKCEERRALRARCLLLTKALGGLAEGRFVNALPAFPAPPVAAAVALTADLDLVGDLERPAVWAVHSRCCHRRARGDTERRAWRRRARQRQLSPRGALLAGYRLAAPRRRARAKEDRVTSAKLALLLVRLLHHRRRHEGHQPLLVDGRRG